MSELAQHNVERLEEALNSPESGAVYALAVELRDSGFSQADLLAVFDAVRGPPGAYYPDQTTWISGNTIPCSM